MAKSSVIGRKPEQGMSDEEAIREAVAAWSKAAREKELDRCLSFYTDDASLLPFNAPIAEGKDQIRHVWSMLMSNPGYSLHFEPTKIEVAKSGDLAYEIGEFDLTLANDERKPNPMRGKYIVVWKKQINGMWKAAADIFNTDQ